MKRSERTTLDTVAIDPVLCPVLRWVNFVVASSSCVKLNAMGIWKMNERIEQLAEQAMDEMDPESFSEDVHIPTEWYQKFAELIVRECASKVDWILAEGGKTQGDLIKEHFGVE